MNNLQGRWKLTYAENDGKGFKPTHDIQISFGKKTKEEWSAGNLAGKFSLDIDATKAQKKWISLSSKTA